MAPSPASLQGMKYLVVSVAVLGVVALSGSSPSASDGVLSRSIAAYRALKSYADTATILHETGSPASPTTARHTFKTYFRVPRHYLYDFLEDKASGGERYVIWGDEQAFRTWWSTSGVETEYGIGKGISAFLSSDGARIVASILFPQAAMPSPITELGETTDEGIEQMNGRKCHKVVGIAKSVYGATGHETNIRRVTLWIDAETMLIRRVFEDTPRGVMRGSIARRTVTFEPHANPVLDDRVFRFVAPTSQR
jgi:hypothetical protein